MTDSSLISLFQLSVSQPENNHSVRPARSSSVTRSSVSSYSNYSSNSGTSILNTSSASVSSYTRPSSPITRSSYTRPSSPITRSPSTARPSAPSPRSTSLPSTPAKIRSSPNGSYIDKSPPSQSSRPSTPTSRPQIHANLNSTAVRSNSRLSTPTRRNPMLPSEAGASPSIGRTVSNGHSAGPASRPSSPGLRVRSSQQPVVPPDFPLDTPANLKTTLPDRPVSAGRSRPVSSVTMKANQDTTSSINTPRRHSSPVVTRGRLAEPHGRTRVHSNGHPSDIHESQKNAPVPDSTMRRHLKSSTTTADNPRFGRTI